MNRKIVFTLFIIFSSIFFIVYSISTNAAPPGPTPPPEEMDKEIIEQAVLAAVDDQREYVMGYLVNDIQVAEIELSQDGSVGIVQLEMVDSVSGELLPSEPGLAFAKWDGSEWKITLPADSDWIDLVESAPENLLSDESKASYFEMHQTEILAAQVTYSGYLLPWEAGKVVYLSQSTGHDQYIPSGSAHYSYDFYIPQTMYSLRAAKQGTVWRARWDVPNGNDSDMGNYLVLKDTSTSPVTYQLYLHLAKDSIPVELRTQGAYVAQGQFIGVADDTGKSTGHHLHFHVHTNPNSYWGTSVDITFADVDINGGRPRRESDLKYCTRVGDVCNQFRNSYISQNVAPGDNTPPSGDLFEPATGFLANSPKLHVEGWSFDDESGFNHAKLIAYYNNDWHEVGNDITDFAFSMDLDLCASNIPDGPLSLALKIWDNAGNMSLGLPGLTHLVKNYSCAPAVPICNPGVNQVSIHVDTDYQGDCLVLNQGEYDQLSSLHVDNIESVKVGSNVFAQVFSESNFGGRIETLGRNDSNLDDNLVGGNQISSIRVSPRAAKPSAPTTLIYPNSGDQFRTDTSLIFSWRDAGGGTQYQVEINGPNGTTTSAWLSMPYWNFPGKQLPEGTYTWKVQARNCPDGCNSPWSQSSTFSMVPSTTLLSTSAPFNDNLENGVNNWQVSGLWKYLNDLERSYSQTHSWYYGSLPDRDYENGIANSGDLTTIPIAIPGNNFQLRFWYRYISEGKGIHWDQRWIQISADGGPFQNALQLFDDEPDFWHQASIDLSAYAGKSVQIRFLFATVDNLQNSGYEGWIIDDIEIAEINPATCIDANNSPQSAMSLSYGQSVSQQICPPGDVDYFQFQATAGDHIVLDIDTPTSPPIDNLDLYLFLIDPDGISSLASHDDEILGVKLDPHLGYQVTRTGTYYVRARLWSHPTHGGEQFVYNLTLTKDNSPPQGVFISPLSGTYLQDSQNLSLAVNVNDTGSGISHVEFLYHSGDWVTSNWDVIGVDQDGSDGWGITFNSTTIPEQKDAAFFANIYDWAGNWFGAGSWDLTLDRTSPVTVLTNLESTQQGTAVKLQWYASDNLSGLNYFELQSRLGTGNWSNIVPNPGGNEDHVWYIGQAGNQYGFRLRGVDRAGNQEPFPVDAETVTTIPNANTICSQPDAWDISGNDNSPGNASIFPMNGPYRVHNFCNPLTADRLGDEDWVSFTVEKGSEYLLESIPLSEATGTILELIAADGTSLITSAQSSSMGEKSRILWSSDRDDKVYLRIRHLDGRVAGNIISYQLKIDNFVPIFLPFIR